MPVEGQAERLVTPLTRRDKRLLLISGAVAALAVLAGALYLALGDRGSTGRCFTATYASSVGGATVHQCGDAAVHYCLVDAGIPQIAEACRKAGFTVGTRP